MSNTVVVKTGIITGLIRIAHSRELKMNATIRKENRILTRRTVSVQSDLRVLNAGISHGAILMMKNMERKPGKNETGLLEEIMATENVPRLQRSRDT
jgi:hypothetical protein